MDLQCSLYRLTVNNSTMGTTFCSTKRYSIMFDRFTFVFKPNPKYISFSFLMNQSLLNSSPSPEEEVAGSHIALPFVRAFLCCFSRYNKNLSRKPPLLKQHTYASGMVNFSGPFAPFSSMSAHFTLKIQK